MIMTFVDNRDGTGELTFIPDYTQGGPTFDPTAYDVVFRVTDQDYPAVSQLSETVRIEVLHKNEPPILTFPDGSGPFQALEGEIVEFEVIVIDNDPTVALPTSAFPLIETMVSKSLEHVARPNGNACAGELPCF